MKRISSHKIRNVFTSLLSQLNVKYTLEYANSLFNEHPHKYDLYGISKMLSDYKVNNTGIRVDNKKDDIFNIDAPFIAHVGNAFVTVSKVSKDKVCYRWDDKDIENSMQQFLDIWSGIVLIAEPDEHSIEPNYQSHERKELFRLILKSIFGAAIIVLLTIFSMKNYIHENTGLILLVIINLIGAYIGYLLVLKQIDVQSHYADKICSLFKQGDCNNVLESPSAKLFGVIGWSEIGFGYFVSNVSLIICIPSYINYIAIINIFTLPYTIWSFWFQKFKAKQWCPLCLAVQFIFWIMFIIDLAYRFIDISSFQMSDSIIVLSIYAILIIGISMLVPKLSEKEKTETITQEMNSIKMKDEVFLACMRKRPYYSIDNSMSNILFGNPNSSFIITILTNPHCSPCAKMHKRVEGILDKVGDQICLQYIFSSFNKELDHTGKFLTAVHLQKNRQEAMSIFNKWYEEGRFNQDKFLSKYSEVVINEEVEEEYSKHQIWRLGNKLSATPTILINGYELPDIYKIEEMEYFTELEFDIKNHC